MTDDKISQWYVVRKDKWLLAFLTYIPVLLAVVLWWIFSQGIIRDLPIGVVDLDNSVVSKQLIRDFDATSFMSVDRSYPDVAAAKHALSGGEIYAYVVVPRNFYRDIAIGNPPRLSVFYNSQYILIGKLINSAITQAHGAFNAKIGVSKQLSKGNNTMLSAIGKAVPIQHQINQLFNRNGNYTSFLVSGIIPALWQVFIVTSIVLVLSANHRIYGLRRMLGHRPLRRLVSICTFYMPVYILMGFGFLSWFYGGLGWPSEGHLLPLVYAQLLTIIACVIMGSFFFFVTMDPARAVSFAGVFTAPSFAFMGITFPVSDMSLPAIFWRNMLPICYYIEAQIGQISYGVSSWHTIRDITPPMLGYIIPLWITVQLMKRNLSKQEAGHVAE